MKNNILVASTGALLGLLYIVFLPVVGIVVALSLLVYRIFRMLRTPATAPSTLPGEVSSGFKPYRKDELPLKRKMKSAVLEDSDHIKTAIYRR